MTHVPPLNPAIGESSPPMGPEFRPGPELRLIQGDGEAMLGATGLARADLHVVPNGIPEPAAALVVEGGETQTAEAMVAESPAGTAHEASAEAFGETGKDEGMRWSVRRRERAAGEAGRRTVRESAPVKVAKHVLSKVAEIVWGEERKKGGGGSWLIREHMRKLEAEAKAKAAAEAESHDSNCDCPLHDALAA